MEGHTTVEMDSQTLKDFQDRLSSALVETTRVVGQICQEDISFQRSVDPDVSAALDSHGARLLQLAQTLLERAVDGSDVDAPRLREQEDVDNSWSSVVDVVDSLLERADTCLDVHTGRVKRSKPEQAEETKAPLPAKGRLDKSLRFSNIVKPQLQFADAGRYDGTGAFKPLLTSKPNAMLPFQHSIVSYTDHVGHTQYRNPYETEIITSKYPPAVLASADPIPYQPFDKTTATYVDTPEGLQAMLTELQEAKEIAIDLEHHELRSYVGLVCLMQISTRGKDWIVDTLKPWRAELRLLNQVFTNPEILKVFHGAFMDVSWLQRDFGLYVVSMFDTYHAARALGFPQASLASLLSRFVGFDADKRYQLADWRIRPLPAEMLKYARSDTHFLLNIYDHLRNELVRRSGEADAEAGPLAEVLKNSRQTALLCYQGLAYDEDSGMGAAGWFGLLKKSAVYLSREQFAVFKAVHHWRDSVGRAEDEGVNFIMQKHVLFAVARALPMDTSSLLGICQPLSPQVRKRSEELLGIIRQAKATGATGPDISQVLQSSSTRSAPERDTVSLERCDGGSANRAAHDPTPKPQPHTAESPMRSGVSQFWGHTFASNSRVGPAAGVGPGGDRQQIRLALPLPPLTAEIFEDGGASATEPRQGLAGEPGSRAEHAFTKDRSRTEDADHNTVFTIKQLGGGRKRKVADSAQLPGLDKAEATHSRSTEVADGNTNNNVEGSDAEEGERAPTQKEKKQQQQRRERRRQQRQLAKEGRTFAITNGPEGSEGGPKADDGDEAGAAPAFDYAAAAAALQAESAEPDQSQSRPRPVRGFNPYGKAADAPHGARRVRKDRPGKTMTFTD